MLLDALEQALQASCWSTAEAGIIEVIARALDISEATVERVLYAATVVPDSLRRVEKSEWGEGPTLGKELQQGIELAINEGAARAVVRSALEDRRDMLIMPNKLIATAAQICIGCPHSIECSVQSYSDPAQCYALGPATLDHTDASVIVRRPPFGMVYVQPLRITDNTVTVLCGHPRGTYKVAAKDLKTCGL